MTNHLQPWNERKSSPDHDHGRVRSRRLVTLERIPGDISGIPALALQEIVEGNRIGVPAVALPLSQTEENASITAVGATHHVIEDIEVDRRAHLEEAVKTLGHRIKLLRLAKYIEVRFRK